MQQTPSSINSDRLFAFLVIIGAIAVFSFVAYMQGKSAGKLEGMEWSKSYYFKKGEEQGFDRCWDVMYNRMPSKSDPSEESI